MRLNTLIQEENPIDGLLVVLKRLDDVGLEDACKKDRDRALYHLLVNHNVLVTRRYGEGEVQLFATHEDSELSFALTKLGLKT